MDTIDSDIMELYKQNKRIPPEKFMIILLTVMGINSAIIIASFYQKSLFIRIVLEPVSQARQACMIGRYTIGATLYSRNCIVLYKHFLFFVNSEVKPEKIRYHENA